MRNWPYNQYLYTQGAARSKDFRAAAQGVRLGADDLLCGGAGGCEQGEGVLHCRGGRQDRERGRHRRAR